MTNDIKSLNSYTNTSKSNLYSLILILPMFILYEFLGYINNYGSDVLIRNGADVIFRNVFLLFGNFANLVYHFVLFLIILYVFYNSKYQLFNDKINLAYLFGMCLESIFWSFFLVATLESIALFFLASPINNDILEQFYLSIGAGIWEEFIFRFFLINIIIFVSKYLLNNSKFSSFIISIVLSSIVFSLFHYIGDYGDFFEWKSFLFRFSGGLFLSILYLLRGLGISVYTHIFYDFIVVALI